MSIKFQGSRRDENWRNRQKQKQHERQEVEKKSEEDAKTDLQEDPESQGMVAEAEQGNSTESGKPTEPSQG